MTVPPRFTPTLLRQLEMLNLSARRRFLGGRQGKHRSLRRGHGMEFADYRDYQPGDSLRHIDWGLYGRSDRLQVKLFQEEQNLSAMLILDCSRSMCDPAWQAKWELARDLIFALSYIALLSQEEVSLCALGNKTEARLVGGRAVHRIGGILEKLEAAPTDRFERDILLAASMVKHPGVSVFVTDLLMPTEQVRRLCDILCQKNLEITIIHVAGALDVDPLGDETGARVIDSETGEEREVLFDAAGKEAYRQRYSEHIDELRSYFHRRTISYTLIEEEDDFYGFIREALGSVGLVQ